MNKIIRLREYQIECLEAVSTEFRQGISRQLIVLPTGSGKTVIMAAIAKKFNVRTLLLAHREELLTQAVDKFKLYWPEVSIGICKAERDEIDCQIVVGSVQTCSRPKRIEALKRQGFELILVDEAHHALADTYQAIINELASKLLVGVTATAMRGDGEELGNMFEKITFARSVGTMIKAGYLSPLIGRKILTNFNVEKIKTRNGDYAIEDLAEAINTEERNNFIVDKFQTYAANRKGVAFCVDVQHCKDLADAFKRAGIACEPVYGEMPSDERSNVLESLKNGSIRLATSCGVLTEGYDEGSIDAVVMARPTKSAALYTQCIGRGLRLWPGKENCLVMDFTDRSHSLDSAMTLSQTIPEALHIREEVQEEEEKEGVDDKKIDKTAKIGAVETSDQAFDIIGATRFCWVDIGDGEWSLLDDDKQEIVMTPDGDGYRAKVYFPDGSSKEITSSPLPLAYCSGVCEDFARRYLKIAFADMTKSWANSSSSPTQGQKDFLQKNEAYVESMSKAQAALEIRKIITLKNKNRRLMFSEPPTNKQKFFLNSHGINIDNMSKYDAIKAISKIKQKV